MSELAKRNKRASIERDMTDVLNYIALLKREGCPVPRSAWATLHELARQYNRTMTFWEGVKFTLFGIDP